MIEFYSQQKMYINEVLYHIDEDYKKWCDTVDMVCEELLLEQKDDWFFNMTPDEQDNPRHTKHIKSTQPKRAAARDEQGGMSVSARQRQAAGGRLA